MEQAPAGPLLSQYPSMLCVVVLPSPDGPSAAIKALLRCALLGLEPRQSCGVHVVVSHSSSRLCDDVYLSAGFVDVSTLWQRNDGCRVFGKRLTAASD